MTLGNASRGSITIFKHTKEMWKKLDLLFLYASTREKGVLGLSRSAEYFPY